MARRKTVVFDFDGVLNSYEKGFIRPTVITDPPVEGIKEEIDKIREKYRVVVVSTRCAYDGGIEAIQKWLNKYGIVVNKVQAEKPPAFAYVDDRAINFNGKAQGLFEKIDNFKNWIDAKKEGIEIVDEAASNLTEEQKIYLKKLLINKIDDLIDNAKTLKIDPKNETDMIQSLINSLL